jgi:DMSO/TMAO reductase YedYZ molybdopterin-dependent catalytic subunit
LIDAFYPQTILAHSLNAMPLSAGHGASRVERQLGYKHAKYVMRIELTNRLDRFGRGKGGFWPDRGYELRGSKWNELRIPPDPSLARSKNGHDREDAR